MAPHADSPTVEQHGVQLPPVPKPLMSVSPPRLMIIGAGSRGNAYAAAIGPSTNGLCVAVVEPIVDKRKRLGRKYIWGKGEPTEGQEFDDWRDFVVWEEERRRKASRGEEVPEGIDGVFICIQDGLHKEAILGLAPLKLHIMCEKPLATTLEDCISIYDALASSGPGSSPSKIFAIGHVLRYSPHNILLRKLLVEEKVIGDVQSIEHTEPVGWYHFSHSYVRGNWRKESTSSPSLLAKSCHDIDLLLWLLCSPAPQSRKPAHIPKKITSTGTLQYFHKGRKPTEAGDATNCLDCNYESSCKFSAKNIYLGSKLEGLATGNTHWPVHIVVPEIEDILKDGGQAAGEQAILAKLRENYDDQTPLVEVEKNTYYGRCVYEADNDVNDDQFVTMTWDNDSIIHPGETVQQGYAGRGAKMATLHMVAMTKKRCERYSYIYGTDGEIFADSVSIVVQNFTTGETKTYYPHQPGGSHGGGDKGLTRQYILAIDRVKNHGQSVATAQREYLGCDLEEAIRSHAMVFAAEKARVDEVVLDFPKWWGKEVAARVGH